MKLHHAGNVGSPEARSITTSAPDTASMSRSRLNEPNRTFCPALVLQANVLLKTPFSPKQWSQRRFNPAADAIVAVSARSKLHNRVTLFIVCLRVKVVPHPRVEDEDRRWREDVGFA